MNVSCSAFYKRLRPEQHVGRRGVASSSHIAPAVSPAQHTVGDIPKYQVAIVISIPTPLDDYSASHGMLVVQAIYHHPRSILQGQCFPVIQYCVCSLLSTQGRVTCAPRSRSYAKHVAFVFQFFGGLVSPLLEIAKMTRYRKYIQKRKGANFLAFSYPGVKSGEFQVAALGPILSRPLAVW